MSHTLEITAKRTALIQRFATLQATVSMTQEELEEQLHAEVWRKDWDEVLRLLDLAKGNVSRRAARECLFLAVWKAPAEIVSAILKLLPQEEYAVQEAYPVDWSPTGEICRRLKWDVSVQGTLTMHAVAHNRPDVLKLLLDHGYDVNCASAAAAAGLLQDSDTRVVSYGRSFIPFHPYTARPENCVKLRSWDTTPNDIPPMQWEGATPLALAILMGHVECARILTGNGAWLEESPSVSAAMYLFWREKDPDYQAARAIVLQKGDHACHRPLLWAIGTTCSSQQLNGVLEAWHYEQAELEQAAREMARALSDQQTLWKTRTDGWLQLCQRMYRIGKLCPEALQSRSVIGPLLDHFLCGTGTETTPLLPFLDGAVLDLSETGGIGLYYLNRPGSQKRLAELAACCKLVMDRDAVPAGLSQQALRTVIKHVTFLPPAIDQGVSSFTKQVLATGDLRLIRHALKTGLIPPEESTEDLLCCQQELYLPAVCRSALLTAPRPKRGAPVHRPLCEDLMGRWFREKMTDGTMPILTEENWQSWLFPTLRCPFCQQTIRINGQEWKLNKALFAVCAAGRHDILEAWLPHLPSSELRNTDSILCVEGHVQLILTPLCMAALAGQTEVVELLLEHGAPLHEERIGFPSIWTEHCGTDEGEKSLPLNPVLAGAIGNHWDTVRSLLARGAVCDWEAPEVQYIWNATHTNNPETTIRENPERSLKT